jgi:hypothetical protein
MFIKTTFGRKIILLTVLFTSVSFHSVAGAKEMKTREELIFTTVVYPTEWSETNALLMVESIRAFAGSLSQAPIWCFVPQYGKKLTARAVDRLTKLDATLMPYDIELEVARFFFAADIRAAGLAESTATGKTDLLVWLNSNTIILKEPHAFILRDDKNMGYRPVHHTNVGSVYDTPLDPFWTLVYNYCNVPEDRVFPMEAHIDGQNLRPYFNAGMLIIRPDKKLFKAWHDTFFKVYQEPDLQNLYKQDERYMIFIHQALLSGIILKIFKQDEIQELPSIYNYPVHLHGEDVTTNRPAILDELITIRHEGFYQDPDWQQKMPATDTLKQWLIEKLPKY